MMSSRERGDRELKPLFVQRRVTEEPKRQDNCRRHFPKEQNEPKKQNAPNAYLGCFIECRIDINRTGRPRVSATARGRTIS